MAKYASDKLASDFVKLPAELEQFLGQQSYSLAIKGKAGTGKTALALTILSETKSDQYRMYISTRMATTELFKYYPWISTLANKSDNDAPDLVEPAEESSIFVDARLDEPTAFFERITNELMDTSSPTIVIDTWDAIGDFMDREAFVTNAKILQVWRQRAQAKLIFVIENTDDKTFDNLVDGIIELEEGEVDSRKTRKIHLSKLRGIKIDRPWYMFSLNGGVFHSYEPFRPTDLNKLTPPSVTERLAESKSSLISTGYEQLDNTLGGGIPRQSIASISLDSEVDRKIALALLEELVRDYTTNGNPVLLQPPVGVGEQFLGRSLERMGPSAKSRKLIHIFSSETATRKKTSNSFIQSLERVITGIRKKYPKKRLLCILCFNPFDDEDSNGSTVMSKRSAYDLLALIDYSRDQNLEQVGGVADLKLRLRKIEGTLFLESESPWTGLFALVIDERDKKLKLDQMV